MVEWAVWQRAPDSNRPRELQRIACAPALPAIWHRSSDSNRRRRGSEPRVGIPPSPISGADRMGSNLRSSLTRGFSCHWKMSAFGVDGECRPRCFPFTGERVLWFTTPTIKLEFRPGTAPGHTWFAIRGIRLLPRGTILARVSSIDLAWTGFGDQPAGHGSPA